MGLFNVFSIEFEQAMIFVDRIAAGVVLVIIITIVVDVVVVGSGGGRGGDFDRRYGRTIGRGVTVLVVGRCDAEDVAHDDGCDEGQV